MEAPDGLILKAMVNGITKGRGGKGSVFVFAAGNGGGQDDQCNFDGYTNSIFSITIGAIDRRGLHPYYSEMCSAMMVVAPSSGSGDHIVSYGFHEIEFEADYSSTLQMSARTYVQVLMEVQVLLHHSRLVSLLWPFKQGKLFSSCLFLKYD